MIKTKKKNLEMRNEVGKVMRKEVAENSKNPKKKCILSTEVTHIIKKKRC